MSKRNAQEMDPADIPAVQEFLNAEEKLNNLKSTYPGVFEEYEEILKERNATLEAADQQVRARGVSCGPWKILNFRTKYEAQALYDAVGHDKFLQLGGSEQTIKQYDIDKKVFDSYVAQNKVPQNVVDAVMKTSPAYSAPKKIV